MYFNVDFLDKIANVARRVYGKMSMRCLPRLLFSRQWGTQVWREKSALKDVSGCVSDLCREVFYGVCGLSCCVFVPGYVSAFLAYNGGPVLRRPTQ